MGHITSDSQRKENAEISACPHRGTSTKLVTEEDNFSGETVTEWREVLFDNCGPWKTLSAAQDKCLRCGKIFTY